MQRTSPRFLVVALALAVGVAACGGGSRPGYLDVVATSTTVGVGVATTTTVPQRPRVEVPSGPAPASLRIDDLTLGTGSTATAGDRVDVKYVGVNFNTRQEFDSNWGRDEAFSFTLGAGKVIAGWGQGVPGMRLGGRRRLVVPAALAYGEQGAPPFIRANDALVFVIDLVGVHPPAG